MNYEKIIDHHGRKVLENYDPIKFRDHSPKVYNLILRCMATVEDYAKSPDPDESIERAEIRDYKINDKKAILFLLTEMYSRYIDKHNLEGYSFEEYLRQNNLY